MIDTPDFAQNLEGWLKNGSQIYAKNLASKKSNIPIEFRNYTGKLYLCVLTDLKFMGMVNNKKMQIPMYTNWYKTKKLALKYPVEYVKNSTIKVLIAKRITPANIVFDIDLFAIFSGADGLNKLGIESREIKNAILNQQVLIQPGVRITTQDYDIIPP